MELYLAGPEILGLDKNNVLDESLLLDGVIRFNVSKYSGEKPSDLIKAIFNPLGSPAISQERRISASEAHQAFITFEFPVEKIPPSLYEVYYTVKDAAGNISTSEKINITVINGDPDEPFAPPKVPRWQPMPIITYGNSRVGLDRDLEIINEEIIDSKTPLMMKLCFAQDAGPIIVGDTVSTIIYIHAYKYQDHSSQQKFISLPDITLTDQHINDSYCIVTLNKKDFIGFDANKDSKPGIMWITATYNNKAHASYSSVWWCNIDTVSPGGVD